MARPGHAFEDDELLEAVELRKKYGSVRAAARETGLCRTNLQLRVRRAAERGLLGTEPVLPGFQISRTTAVRESDGTISREYIQQRPESGDEFEVPDGHSISGVSSLVGHDNRVINQWIKTRADKRPLTDIVGEIREALGECTAPPSISAPVASEIDLATVYVVADWHVGLLAWGPEAGQHYDMKIAEATILPAMSRLVGSSPAASQAIVLGLGDLLHSDGYDNMTARSKNLLDVDGRYPRVLKTAVKLLIHTIELALQKHDTVLVRILPGNHDDESAIAVTLALSMRYENHDRVTVDDDPSRFWWWRFGNVFLGATHGDQAKMPQLPLLMATERPEDWGATKYRSVYTGHLHTKTGIEMGGVTVESFQTPVARDAWHAGMGYNASRSVCSITHHRKFGEVGRSRVAIIREDTE